MLSTPTPDTTTDFPTTPAALQREPGGGTGCGGAVFLCGDAFVTKVAAAGPGATSDVAVSMASDRATAGRNIDVGWSGIAAPNVRDRIGIYALGHSDAQFDVYWGWTTTGASAGTISIALPASLAPGWYELRLWSGDPSVFTPLARSAPLRVGTILDIPSGGGGGGGGGVGEEAGSTSATSSDSGGGAASGWFFALLTLAVALLAHTRAGARLERERR